MVWCKVGRFWFLNPDYHEENTSMKSSENSILEISPEEFSPMDPRLTNGRWVKVVNDLRNQCPVFHSSAHEDDGYYVLTRYDDLLYAHLHPEIYSSCPITIPPAGLTRPWGVIESDPPIHKPLRALLNPQMSKKAIVAQEQHYRDIAISLIEPVFGRGQAELVEEIFKKFPLQIILELFGTPEDEKPRLVELFHILAHRPGEREDPAEIQRITAAAAQELYQYFAGLLELRREKPGDDLISILSAAEIDGEALTDYEIVDYAMIIVPAGFETTAYGLSHAFKTMAHLPEVRRELINDPSLIPSFIEEVLRYESPSKGLARTVMVDHEVQGHTLKRGDRVLLLWASGNRDPGEFDLPDEFDLHRKPNRHLSFGMGAHRCMGIHMARLSMRVMIEEWLARVPEFELDWENVKETPGFTWAVSALPARWSVEK
jgi:cytochrome P450